uniref:Ribosomal RNA processing 9, U3 small nucleolar RNA binding protein n=1 Tax=Oryzias sinensis TaxID=183150 RepID=A0A8C7XTW9_9TELE
KILSQSQVEDQIIINIMEWLSLKITFLHGMHYGQCWCCFQTFFVCFLSFSFFKLFSTDPLFNCFLSILCSFGHQDAITGLDSLSRERCVTAGGRDGTVRVWKIAEESQLVFHGHEGSIDCIQLINEEHMITGADDGSVSLWSVNKKKPLSTVKQAHGCHGDAGLEQPHWVSSVAALQNSDTVASGSHNSQVNVWKCGQHYRGLELLFSVPVSGFVNDLKFSSSGHFLVAGVGQEHRLGRWWRLKEAKNGIFIIPLKRKPNSEEPKTTQ